ncbi:Uncharacterized membrane protein [Natronorubrum sediminis]|uniref:Uncharacterized membrane protein n=1 Tax=Natronorubrum sediminis TaxID=640943 RepID=A0A1H6FRA5_9EURY|nr:DUF2085 domain-containing protein [Natronorubrum sediminis]SEH12393.1 Uncharacterized membrane protein [Natronorubrum sediminis]
MKIDLAELRRGVASMGPYVLSHHLLSERHRCYSPTVFGRRVDLCSRCLGIYPGILLGLYVANAGHFGANSLLVVAVFPLPALLDWTLTTYTKRRGYNVVRTATGFLLGYGYGLGLVRLFLKADSRVFGVGIAYAVVAGMLLYVGKINN